MDLSSLSPEMLQGLQGLMQNPGSASGNYHPRFTAPDISASQGFSLAQTLGRFGEGAGMAGMVGDMLLPMFFKSQGGGLDWSNIVNRINLARGVANPIREVQARQYSQVMSSLGTQDLGMAATNALHLQPGSMLSNVLMSGAPVIDQLTGGLVSDVARFVDPNLITSRGGAGLISAQRGLDAMHRLDSAMAGHLKNTLQERSRVNARGQRYGDIGGSASDFMLRDNTLTSGMNLDDFSEVMSMAVDLNALDYSGSLRGGDLEKKARATLAARVGAGFTADQLAAEMKGIRLAGATVQGGANLARVISTLGSTIGEGLSVGERGNLAAQLGLVPGGSADAGAIQDVLRNLKALGEAAGMTSKQMLDAGTAITRQMGGSLLINTATAAFSQTARRLTGQALNEEGLTGFQGILDESKSRTAQGALRAQQADLLGAAMWGLDHPTLGPQFHQALATGDGPAAVALLESPQGRRVRSQFHNATQAQRQVIFDAAAVKFGPVIQAYLNGGQLSGHLSSLTLAGEVTGEDGKRISLIDLHKKLAAASVDDSELAVAIAMNPARTQSDRDKYAALATKLGLPPIYDLQNALVYNNAALEQSLSVFNSGRRVEKGSGANRRMSELNQKIASMLAGTLNTQGLGRAIDTLRDQHHDLFSVASLGKILEMSNLMLPGDRTNALLSLEGMSEDQRRTMGNALTEYYDSQVEWSKSTGNTDPSQREALRNKWAAASSKLANLGIKTPGVGGMHLSALGVKSNSLLGYMSADMMNPVGAASHLASYLPTSSKNDGETSNQGGPGKTPKEVTKKVTLVLNFVVPSGVSIAPQNSNANDKDMSIRITHNSVETAR